MVVKSLVDEVDSVEVREVEQQGGTLIEVRVAPSDMGKLIGRQGRTIRALRSLAVRCEPEEKHRFMLEIVGMNSPSEET